jgi:hypothetical protein
MTDAEFEELNAELLSLIRNDLIRRRARCRDCDREDPEFYMIRNDVWQKAVPGGGGVLCLACLTKRLGRPLADEDFGDPPE